MAGEVVVFRYSGWIIPQAAAVISIGLFGVWRLVAYTPARAAGRWFFILTSAYMFWMAAKNLHRAWDRIVITDRAISRMSWFKETSIEWNEVSRIKRYKPFVEEPGLRVISRSGTSIVFTQHITGFHELVNYVAERIPEDVRASTAW
jgi:hypothetical protein